MAEENTKAINMKRTGKNKFVVEHDDGSLFECDVKNTKQADYMHDKLKQTKGKPTLPKRLFNGFGTGTVNPKLGRKTRIRVKNGEILQENV